MLFIGRTMNKETQLGRKEKGREKGGNPRSCAYYLWNLTVITESVLCKCVRMRVFFPLVVRLLPRPVLQKEVPLTQ